MRSAAERGSGASGRGSAALIAPLLQNLVLSVGDNEELCYCLKAWQELPGSIQSGNTASREDALKASSPSSPAPLPALINSIERHYIDLAAASLFDGTDVQYPRNNFS